LFERDLSGTFEKGNGGYGYNYFYLGSAQWNGIWDGRFSTQVSQVKKPSRTVMFADAAFTDNYQISGNLIEYHVLEPENADSWSPTPSTHFRHKKNADSVFVDGHVAALRMEDSADGYGGFNLGFPCKNDTEGKNKYFHPEQ
jgi:prepilin-type processing-associated H-X9-DG protein